MRAFLLILIVPSLFVKRSTAAAGLAVLAGAAFAAHAVDRGWRRMESGVTGDALWIWSTDDVRAPHAARFTATRSFALDAPVPAARAKIFVDGGYRLVLDGREIGRGAMRPGDALDVFDVPGGLAAGAHVLAVEAASATGIGGILCAVDLEGRGRSALVSDATWTIDGRPAFVWGRPPMYPWGFPRFPVAK